MDASPRSCTGHGMDFGFRIVMTYSDDVRSSAISDLLPFLLSRAVHLQPPFDMALGGPGWHGRAWRGGPRWPWHGRAWRCGPRWSRHGRAWRGGPRWPLHGRAWRVALDGRRTAVDGAEGNRHERSPNRATFVDVETDGVSTTKRADGRQTTPEVVDHQPINSAILEKLVINAEMRPITSNEEKPPLTCSRRAVPAPIVWRTNERMAGDRLRRHDHNKVARPWSPAWYLTEERPSSWDSIRKITSSTGIREAVLFVL